MSFVSFEEFVMVEEDKDKKGTKQVNIHNDAITRSIYIKHMKKCFCYVRNLVDLSSILERD